MPAQAHSTRRLFTGFAIAVFYWERLCSSGYKNAFRISPRNAPHRVLTKSPSSVLLSLNCISLVNYYCKLQTATANCKLPTHYEGSSPG